MPAAQITKEHRVKVNLVFYDLTTTYFSQKSPQGKLRQPGHSKGGRSRRVQVVVGVVMANGFPIAHHVFAGNQSEKTTLQEVLTAVDRRFGGPSPLEVGEAMIVGITLSVYHRFPHVRVCV